MAEFESDIGAVSTQMGEISMKAAVSQNRERARIARGNIRATVDQLELEESETRKNIARDLAMYQGKLAVDAAYRGGGDATQGHASQAAMFQASERGAVATANKAAKEAAFVASQDFIKADPFLALMEGGVQGAEMGISIAKSLLAEAQDTTRISRQHIGTRSGFGVRGGIADWSVDLSRFLDIPGFNFGKLLGVE
jgi:hypothetical protein